MVPLVINASKSSSGSSDEIQLDKSLFLEKYEVSSDYNANSQFTWTDPVKQELYSWDTPIMTISKFSDGVLIGTKTVSTIGSTGYSVGIDENYDAYFGIRNTSSAGNIYKISADYDTSSCVISQVCVTPAVSNYFTGTALIESSTSIIIFYQHNTTVTYQKTYHWNGSVFSDITVPENTPYTITGGMRFSDFNDDAFFDINTIWSSRTQNVAGKIFSVANTASTVSSLFYRETHYWDIATHTFKNDSILPGISVKSPLLIDPILNIGIAPKLGWVINLITEEIIYNAGASLTMCSSSGNNYPGVVHSFDEAFFFTGLNPLYIHSTKVLAGTTIKKIFNPYNSGDFLIKEGINWKHLRISVPSTIATASLNIKNTSNAVILGGYKATTASQLLIESA